MGTVLGKVKEIIFYAHLQSNILLLVKEHKCSEISNPIHPIPLKAPRCDISLRQHFFSTSWGRL